MTEAKIYVSSTFEDLRAYRAAVSRAIRRLGHVDLAMEYYVPEPQRPLAKCLDDVRRADLYLGIFARRYGYVPPGEALSITEQELREAQRAEADVLCFFLDEEAEWPQQHVETGPGAERLQKLKAELQTDYLGGFFDSPGDLAAVATAAVVRALELGNTPFDADREYRLMKSWRQGARLERARAGRALANMASPRYAATLVDRVLAADPVEDLEEIVVNLDELVQMSTTSRHVMPLLLDLVRDESAEKRRYAIFQLGELGLRGKEIDSGIVECLTERERDPEPAVRAELAHSLGKIHHGASALPKVKRCLERLAADSESAVRERATESLGRLRDG